MAIKKIKITIKRLEESFKEAKKFADELDRGIIKKHTSELSFETFETYKKILTPKRLELLRLIKSKKPETINELAKISNRDFKNIYDDIKILKSLDLVKLKKSAKGLKPVTQYDEIDIDIRIPLEIAQK